MPNVVFAGVAAVVVAGAAALVDACAVAPKLSVLVEAGAGVVEAVDVGAALEAGVCSPNPANNGGCADAVVPGCEVADVLWVVARLGNNGPVCLGCSADCVEGVAGFAKSGAGAEEVVVVEPNPAKAGALLVAV